MGKTAAGFVIFRRFSSTIEYLLLQTSYGIHHWTPPKGHTDPGENELTTALRETEEESGLDKSDFRIIENAEKVIQYEVNGKPKKVTYFLAELTNPNAKVQLSDEHQDYKWLGLQEACNYSEFQEMKNVLLYFDNYIKNLKNL